MNKWYVTEKFLFTYQTRSHSNTFEKIKNFFCYGNKTIFPTKLTKKDLFQLKIIVNDNQEQTLDDSTLIKYYNFDTQNDAIEFMMYNIRNTSSRYAYNENFVTKTQLLFSNNKFDKNKLPIIISSIPFKEEQEPKILEEKLESFSTMMYINYYGELKKIII